MILKIIVAQNSGFCFGVKEAINSTMDILDKYKEEKMIKNNQKNAKNFGELIYKNKISSEFSIEMDRSIKEWIKDFTG